MMRANFEVRGMKRKTYRIAGLIGLVLFVAGCDKCGNVNINLPTGAKYKVCSDTNPQG
jgi:hypothetical protein